MIIQLQKAQRVLVRLNRDLSGTSPIVNGVKQGCVLAPTLFGIFFSMMFKQDIEDLDDDGARYIRYCYYSTAVCLTSGDCITPQITRAAVPWPLLCWQCCPPRPHRKSPAAPNFLLCRGCPALRTRGQLKEDWDPPPVCTPRRVPPSLHSVELSWKQLISSLTWGVPSHQTPRST